MRKISDIYHKRYLGKWVAFNSWYENFYCVGESDENVYLWYGYHNEDLINCIYVYFKKNLNVIKGFSTEEIIKMGWINVGNFTILDLNFDDKITWIK